MEPSKNVSSECKVYVKHFPVATTDFMKDYDKPLRNPRDHFVLHVEKNDLISNQTSEEIVASIINLASAVEGESYGVNISSILHKTDDKRLHQKGCGVNDHVRK